MHNFAAAAVRTFVTRCWDNVYTSFKATRYLIQSFATSHFAFENWLATFYPPCISTNACRMCLPGCRPDGMLESLKMDQYRWQEGVVLGTLIWVWIPWFNVNETGFRSQLPAACWLSQLEETTIKISVWPSRLLLAPESVRSLSSGHWSASMFCGTRKSFRLTTTWTTMMQFLPHLPLWSRRLELAGIPKVLL